VLLPLIFAVPFVEARIYHWVDDAGTSHYSSTPPPEVVDRQRRVLDSRGLEREVLRAPATAGDREREAQAREMERQEALRREEEKARVLAARAAQVARARQLHHAYADVDEIIEVRDRRVAEVTNRLLLSERQQAALQRDHDRIAAQIEGAGRDQERYRTELADLSERLERELRYQEGQRALIAEIAGQAEADLEDYRRLVRPGPAHQEGLAPLDSLHTPTQDL
jgi:hypothetical protein